MVYDPYFDERDSDVWIANWIVWWLSTYNTLEPKVKEVSQNE